MNKKHCHRVHHANAYICRILSRESKSFLLSKKFVLKQACYGKKTMIAAMTILPPAAHVVTLAYFIKPSQPRSGSFSQLLSLPVWYFDAWSRQPIQDSTEFDVTRYYNAVEAFMEVVAHDGLWRRGVLMSTLASSSRATLSKYAWSTAWG